MVFIITDRAKRKRGLAPPLTLFFEPIAELEQGFIFFGITHLSFYKPGPRLRLRFRSIDMISTSQYFPLLGGLILHSPMSKSQMLAQSWTDAAARFPKF
jgi:hypothetical protein